MNFQTIEEKRLKMNFLLLEEYIIDIINIDETPTNSITG